MAFADLRTFIDHLEKEGELLRVKKPVSRKFEISAYLRKTCDVEGPAVYFENVRGYSNPVVGGIFSKRKRVLDLLQAKEDNVIERFIEGMSNPRKPRLVARAACQELVSLGTKADVLQLPNPVYSELDGGPYITLGAVVSKDPDTGIRNVGIYRCQVKGKRKLSIMAQNSQHVMVHYRKAEALNKPLEIAIAMGLDPTIVLAAGAKLPYGVDELDIAGGIRGAPVDIAKCKTVEQEVPASSEIVIEGKILPHVREDEGPFGEFTGYYSGWIQKMPVIEVSAITQRRGAIYQAANTGVPVTENHVIKEIPWEAAAFADLNKKFPDVRAVHYHPAGGAQFVVFVSVRQRYKGLARNIIASLLGNPLPPKVVVVVDDDVDIFNLNQVFWAITTRAQPDEDVIILSGMSAGQLDPSTTENEVSSIMGIDATRPVGRDFPKVVRVPGVGKIPDLAGHSKE